MRYIVRCIEWYYDDDDDDDADDGDYDGWCLDSCRCYAVMQFFLQKCLVSEFRLFR